MQLVIKGRKHPRLPLLVWCGQLSFLLNWIAGFFDQQVLSKESFDMLVFCMELVIKERLHPRLWLLVGSGQLCASGQIGFQDSLVINISGRKQFIPLSGHCYFVFLFYLFLGIIYQTLQGSI